MKPVAWVKYSVGKLPHFVPVIGGSAMFECSAIEALEYEPLYTADMLERLARQVPPDCVVVPREPTEHFIAWLENEMPAGTIIGDPYWWAKKLHHAMIAAGEVNL